MLNCLIAKLLNCFLRLAPSLRFGARSGQAPSELMLLRAAPALSEVASRASDRVEGRAI